MQLDFRKFQSGTLGKHHNFWFRRHICHRVAHFPISFRLMLSVHPDPEGNILGLDMELISSELWSGIISHKSNNGWEIFMLNTHPSILYSYSRSQVQSEMWTWDQLAGVGPPKGIEILYYYSYVVVVVVIKIAHLKLRNVTTWKIRQMDCGKNGFRIAEGTHVFVSAISCLLGSLGLCREDYGTRIDYVLLTDLISTGENTIHSLHLQRKLKSVYSVVYKQSFYWFNMILLLKRWKLASYYELVRRALRPKELRTSEKGLDTEWKIITTKNCGCLRPHGRSENFIIFNLSLIFFIHLL